MIKLVATCVEANQHDLVNYDISEHEIQFAYFRRLLTAEEFNSLCEMFGYRNVNNKAGMRMETDWHVRYGYGHYQGKKVICVHHSAIHHFFAIEHFGNDASKPMHTMEDDELHRYCPKCDDYFPATTEFFYQKAKRDRARSPFESCCKACYMERKVTYKSAEKTWGLAKHFKPQANNSISI